MGKIGLSVNLIGLLKLDEFKKKYASVRGPLNAWILEVQVAAWKSNHCIKCRYSSADILPGDKVIFNIKGNHYRLVTKVNFANQIVLVEWIGTHAEYSKKIF